MSNSATALDSLGLSLPHMEDGEKGTTSSDKKALGLFFCSKKRQLTRSEKLRTEAGIGIQGH